MPAKTVLKAVYTPKWWLPISKALQFKIFKRHKKDPRKQLQYWKSYAGMNRDILSVMKLTG